jgi:OOP family OmpA-OmpF porin
MPVGFGHTRPIVPNDTTENRARNRRVAFVRAALNGRSIGGEPLDGGGKVAGDPCH